MHSIARARGWLAKNWDWLLILSCLPLLATKNGSNLPVGIMMFIGIARTIKRPREIWADPLVRLMTVMLLCFELPLLLSLPGAANLQRAAETAVLDLRFWFVGVFVIETLRREAARRKLFIGSAVVVGIWCVDGLIQYVLGYDLLGYPYNGSRLSGIFHPKLRLGTVTATMSPLIFEIIRCHAPRHRWLWSLLAVMVIAVFLSGSRTAWLMLGVSVVVYGAYLLTIIPRRRRVRVVGTVAGALVLALGVASLSPDFRSRVEVTMGLFGDHEAADAATAHRLPLWRTAWEMFKGEWVNGVGPRGYRYVYEEYAAREGFWMESMEQSGATYPQTHPHQMLLEIAAETGVPGLIGYVVLWIVAVRAVVRAPGPARSAAMPWAVGALVAWFPLNAHMALYATYWSTTAWWLLLITVGMLASRAPPDASSTHN